MLVDKIRVGKRHRSHGDEAPGNDAARRGNETFTLEQRYIASFSRFDDGRVAEIFLQDHKPGSQSDSNARDSAIAASLALQYGCALDVLRRALLREAIGTAARRLVARWIALPRSKARADEERQPRSAPARPARPDEGGTRTGADVFHER